MCAELDPLYHFERLQVGIFVFLQKETGAESVAMVMAQQMSFYFFCDVRFLVPSLKNTASNISGDILD